MIEAVSLGCKGTLADGSVRYTIEFGPTVAAEAAQLFGLPGVPVVLARLTQAAAQASAQAETIAGDKQKGGALSKLAGMWCREPEFYEFIRPIYDRYMGGTGSGTGDIDCSSPELSVPHRLCRHAILVLCGISSRAELDHNARAARLFNEKVREPYMTYLRQSA